MTDATAPAFAYREARYARRFWLWRHSTLERVRKCGRARHSARVELRLRAGRAGYAGLVTCGSVWACPVCSAKVQQRRALEIGHAVRAWEATGGRVHLATFTMRHTLADDLAQLWPALGKAWGAVTAGAGWNGDRARHGVGGWLRVVEVTYSERNGWHVHIHVLVFTGGKVEPAVLQRSMFGRWSRSLERSGLRAPLLRGQDIRPVTAGEAVAAYLTKTDNARRVGLELTGSQSKTARGALGTKPAWDLLTAAIEGNQRAMRRWTEYERISKGRRQLTWSHGFRRELLAGVELTDDEIAAEVIGDSTDALLTFDDDAWQVVISRPEHCAGLLNAAESGGRAAVLDYCARNGIPTERSLALEDRLTQLAEKFNGRDWS